MKLARDSGVTGRFTLFIVCERYQFISISRRYIRRGQPERELQISRILHRVNAMPL